MPTIPKYKNWKDFKLRNDRLPNHQKGAPFEVFTKLCLEIHPIYKTKLKHVWLLKNVPAKVHEYLNLPGPDEGIDLIAETNEGDYWAIQCKYKSDETESLTKDDIDSFISLAFSKCENIKLGLACTNTDRISTKLSGYNLQFLSGEFWRSLDEEFFKIFYEHIKGNIVLPEAKKPRDHQKLAIKKAHRHFVKEQNARGKLIMPCGTGKSLTAFWIAEKLKSKNILIAVPSLALIRQTLEIWIKESVAKKKKVNWIVICSDKSVGDIEKDDIVVLTQDLGIQPYTDLEKIRLWLKKPKTGHSIVFTTYQSGKVIANAAKKEKITFDLGIMDEAHKTVGKQERLFSHLLYEKNIKIEKRIFMTATERRYQGKSEKVLTMENPNIYGETFELLTVKEALRAKPPILCDYKIVTFSTSRSDIKKLIKKNIFVKPDKGKWDKEVEAEMLSALVGLNKAVKNKPIKKIVSFHSSISRSKAFKKNQDIFTKAFKGYKKLKTFHVSGKTPTSLRSRELELFENSKHGLVTNARCLTEGVDIPNIDCVIFADPKKSKVDIVQAVGRALRPHEDKKYGYILVPLLFDKKITDDIDKQKEAFAPILMTLRALAADDERIVEYFRSIAEGKQHSEGNIHIDIDIPDGLDIDADEFEKSIKLQFWSKLAKLSWRPFEEAREFVCSLKLKSQNEWNLYARGKLKVKGKPKKPDDIPNNPNLIYKDQGWINNGDWIGTGTIATFEMEFRPFKEAREFVHGLNLNGQNEWNLYARGKLTVKGKPKKPDDIPKNPHLVYANKGWINLGDWLGTGTIATKNRKYWSFKKARKFVRSLSLKNATEWKQYAKGELKVKGKPKKPADIPSAPWHYYEDKGYKSIGDWIGTGRIADNKKVWRPFEEAREFARGLKLASAKEWRTYAKSKYRGKPIKPEDIPYDCNKVYKDKGWVTWPDWLGTNAKPRKRV